MEKDIVPELLEKIQKEFHEKFSKSEKIKALEAKVRDGTATYIEAQRYAEETGEILAQVLKKHITEEALPDGRMYYNIAQRILQPTLGENHKLITDITTEVQNTLNKKAGLGIKAIVPEFNQERIDGLVNHLDYAETYKEISRTLDEPIKQHAMSVVSDAIEANAKFQYDAGLQPKIVREAEHKCCEWCDRLKGAFRYPDEVPADVYRRHDRCRCTVDYVIGKKIQNVHTKKWQRKDVSQNADYMGKPRIQEISIGGKRYAIKTYKNDNYENIWCQTYSSESQKMCEYLNNAVNSKYPGVQQIVIARQNALKGIAAYDYDSKTFFICEELIDETKFLKIVDTDFFAARDLDDILVHELGGHKRHWEAVERYYNNNANRFKSIQEAKQELESELRKYITAQISNDSYYLAKCVSDNAFQQFSMKKILNECIADATILMEREELKDEHLKMLIEEAIFYDGNAK